MKRSWCSRSLGDGLRAGLQAAAVLSLLSGCSVSNSLFGSSSSSTPEPVPGPAAQSTTQPGTQPTGAQTFPNLGTVPNQAPATTSSADRQQITSGLVADNQNAAYSDQPVTAQQTGTPVPAPIPAPVPAPAPAGAAASTVTTPAPEPSAVSQTATNQPAPEPTTASQVTTQAPAVQPAAAVPAKPVTPPAPEPSAVSQTATNQPAPEPTTTSQVTTQAPAVQPAATVPAQPVTPPAPEPSAVSQTATNQPAPEPTTASQVTTQAPAVQPAATVPPQPVTPPAPAVGATPLAPPPNPIPLAPAGGAMTADQSSANVDTSQPGGAPAGATQTAGQPIALIFFADASAGLSNRDKNVLHDVYLLQQQQGGRLRIVGHASQRTAALDPARRDRANYKLSASRANAVARALIGMGVSEGTVSIVAEGSQAPAFYENSPTGEAGNRRVDIYLDR